MRGGGEDCYGLGISCERRGLGEAFDRRTCQGFSASYVVIFGRKHNKGFRFSLYANPPRDVVRPAGKIASRAHCK